MKPIQTQGQIEYHFERRRYGTGASTKFFTWLIWRKAGTKEWQTFGDPWPKVRLNRNELTKALNDIQAIIDAVDPQTKALIDAEVFGEHDSEDQLCDPSTSCNHPKCQY